MASQLLVDLYECDGNIIDDMEKIKEISRRMIREIHSEIVEECSHKFEPIGITYIAVITTSHFSIHTWPEYHYAAVDILPDPEKEEILFRLLKKMIQSGVHLPWFMQYHKSDVDFDSLLDKTILEYHARGEGVVKFRYLPIGKDFEDLTWKVVTMYPVCRRVFFTEHILFFGESMQYEIIEETAEDISDDVVEKTAEETADEAVEEATDDVTDEAAEEAAE